MVSHRDPSRSTWEALRAEAGILDLLLLAVPAAALIRYVPAWHRETALFIAAGLAMVPLAGWMGRATEQLADRAGPGIGGLLNATFGNAAELIIALMALSRGLTAVVKASITGSIIGNLLLVLGAAIFAGGLKQRVQRFNRTAAHGGATSLALAATALLIPTVFHATARRSPDGWSRMAEQHLSLALAGVLFLTYGAWLLFSLRTHRQLFAGKRGDDASGDKTAAKASPHEASTWSIRRSLLVLASATALVAWMSELLVSSIEAARAQLGLTEVFVGVIVVAIIGNAAEHASAVFLARRDQLDGSLGIAVGSSLQVALFVTPVLVFASYLFGRPMDLEFTLPEIVAVTLAVWTVGMISNDGESNWMEGVQLLSVYAVLAILFFFLPAPAGAPTPP